MLMMENVFARAWRNERSPKRISLDRHSALDRSDPAFANRIGIDLQLHSILPVAPEW